MPKGRRDEALSLWARQSVGFVRKIRPAAEIRQEIDREAKAIFSATGSMTAKGFAVARCKGETVGSRNDEPMSSGAEFPDWHRAAPSLLFDCLPPELD